MSTQLQTIITMSRDRLNEPAARARFWSDAELLRYMNRGIRRLWRRLKATNNNFFHQISVSVTQDVNATQLTGVPTNCTQVHGLEPVDLATFNALRYEKRDYNHRYFQAARAADNSVDPLNGSTIYYDITQQGAPVAAPVILVSPKLSTQVTLRLTFTPTIGAELIATDPNPIPGESDDALMHYTVAYAKGRQQSSQLPDAQELAMFKELADEICGSETPRDDSEPEVTESMFEDWW